MVAKLFQLFACAACLALPSSEGLDYVDHAQA